MQAATEKPAMQPLSERRAAVPRGSLPFPSPGKRMTSLTNLREMQSRQVSSPCVPVGQEGGRPSNFGLREKKSMDFFTARPRIESLYSSPRARAAVKTSNLDQFGLSTEEKKGEAFYPRIPSSDRSRWASTDAKAPSDYFGNFLNHSPMQRHNVIQESPSLDKGMSHIDKLSSAADASFRRISHSRGKSRSKTKADSPPKCPEASSQEIDIEAITKNTTPKWKTRVQTLAPGLMGKPRFLSSSHFPKTGSLLRTSMSTPFTESLEASLDRDVTPKKSKGKPTDYFALIDHVNFSIDTSSQYSRYESSCDRQVTCDDSFSSPETPMIDTLRRSGSSQNDASLLSSRVNAAKAKLAKGLPVPPRPKRRTNVSSSPLSRDAQASEKSEGEKQTDELRSMLTSIIGTDRNTLSHRRETTAVIDTSAGLPASSLNSTNSTWPSESTLQNWEKCRSERSSASTSFAESDLSWHARNTSTIDTTFDEDLEKLICLAQGLAEESGSTMRKDCSRYTDVDDMLCDIAADASLCSNKPRPGKMVESNAPLLSQSEEPVLCR